MNSNVKISIPIPCYEMHGKGDIYLEQLFSTIKKQTYKNVEVIVSDHSQTNIIKDAVGRWSNVLDVKYIRNENKRGSSSANVNYAIQNCTGEIIKPVFQDDFFYSKNYLEKLVTEFYTSDKIWGASACNHTNENNNGFFNVHPATYQGLTPTGTNTIGAPSVIFFKKEVSELFDENLIWLMDCEFYYRLLVKYGTPLIMNDIMNTVRIWENNVSNTLATEEVRKQEELYVANKYQIQNV